MIFYTKAPEQCNDDELQTFYKLVVKGGKVSVNDLKNKIKNCELLGFCINDGQIIGVSAMKKPTEKYRKDIIAKAKVERQWSELTYEVGYSFTEVEYRKQGISSELKRRLLKEIKTTEGIIFSTTASPSSQKFFMNNGFQNVGKSYEGKDSETIKYYEKSLTRLKK